MKVVFVILLCFAGLKAQIITNIPSDGKATKQKDSSAALPGGTKASYSEFQELNFRNALSLRVPVSSRLEFDLLNTQYIWDQLMAAMKPDPIEIARRNLLDNYRDLMEPSEIERVQHQIDIINSLYVPGVKTLQTGGLKVNVNDIMSFVGLAEDISPVLNYSLDKNSEIEIVIYSIQGIVVKTIFKGQQPAGTYTFQWNYSDDTGRKMPSGDYIGEIRIGNEKYIRKRIQRP